MGKLSDAAKRFVVVELACFTAPTEVVKRVKERFNIDITLTGVQFYDPNTARGKQELGAKWRVLFEETRKRYSADLSTIPIAQQAWRLQQLLRQYRKLVKMGNVLGAAAILEQAAKETGGMYSNKRILVGANDAPLIPERPDKLTRDEINEQVDDLLDVALARRAASLRN